DERQGLAVLVEKHVGLRARGRALATLERAQLAAPGIVVEEEGAAADAGALRLDEPEHRLYRYRGVDRLASPGEDLEPGIDGERIGGRDPGRLGTARVPVEPENPGRRRGLRCRRRCRDLGGLRRHHGRGEERERREQRKRGR